MRIISKKKIREYSINHTQAELPLLKWSLTMQVCEAKNFNELKNSFNSVDAIHRYTIFNIGGNNYKLITAIQYSIQRCYIKAIWTHTEYSKSYNQITLQRGHL